MALITQGDWASIVQKDLSLVFINKYRDFNSMLGYLFNFKDAEQGTEYDLETGDIPLPGEFNGDIPYTSDQEGYKKSVSEVEYALGIKIQRKALRNDRYGVLQTRTSLLAQSFNARKEQLGADVFNNANSTFTVGDGLSLCNSAHTSKMSATTQSNYGTLALSAANLFTTETYFKKFRTNVDNIMTNIPNLLIVPMDLRQTAFEILESAGKVDTSVNNRNYFYNAMYDVIVWDNFLTSSSAWFIANSDMMKEQLVYREWEPTQFFRSGEFDTLVLKMAGYMSCAVSSVEWRYLYGNFPA